MDTDFNPAAVGSMPWLDSECIKAEASGDAVASQRRHGRDDNSLTPYYDSGGVTIYHGDCREIIQRLKFDCVVTDPPYGVSKKYGQHDDSQANLRELVKVFRLFGPRALVTCGIGNIWRYPEADWVLCWWKPNAMTRASVANANIWEPVLVYGCKGFGRDGVEACISPQPFDHPCPKPEKLFRWLISQACSDDDVILDPFMGSGTTLRCAKDLGRRAIGIDIEERYCEIAAKRMSQEVLNFAPSEPRAADLGGVRSGASRNTTAQESNAAISRRSESERGQHEE